MRVTRREFLILGGTTAAGAVVLSACGVPEREFLVASPVNSPEDVGRGQNNWYATTWPEATNAEGVIARVNQGRVNKLAGNKDHPTNRGKQSAFYDAGLQLHYHPDRIKTPLYRRTRSSRFGEISWQDALELVDQMATDKSADGVFGNGTNLFVTNPLTGRTSWVVDQFIDRFGGRRRSFDPLEQSVLHDTFEKVFGSRRLPYLDIANAGAVLSFGADWLSTWVSPVEYSVAYGKFRSNEQRGYFVHAEPRMSMTAANADIWLPVKPGCEGALAITMANAIIELNLASSAKVSAYRRWIPSGLSDTYSVNDALQNTGVSPEKVLAAARAIATHEPAMAFGGGSAVAHTNGSFNILAVLALNELLAGFGQKGGISANPAPPIENVGCIKHGSPISDFEQEIAQWEGEFVNTLFVRGVDLLYGLPDYLLAEASLQRVNNVVVFTSFMNKTAMSANLILPETSFLEEWGVAIPDPAPGHETLTFQQAVAGGNTITSTNSLGFGDVLLQVALNAGVPIDNLASMQDVVRRTAADLRASVGSRGSITASSDDDFLNGVLQRGGWWDTKSSESSTTATPINANGLTRQASFSSNDSEHDFYLVPFKPCGILDGRLAPSPWAQQIPDPMSTVAWATWAEMNKDEAKELGIKEGDVIYIRSDFGQIEAIAYPTPAGVRGTVGVPLGQGNVDSGRYAAGLGSNVLKMMSNLKDEQSGSLAWGANKVKVVKKNTKAKLPKVEGDVEAFPREPGVPVLVVKPGQTAHDAEEENHHLYQQEAHG